MDITCDTLRELFTRLHLPKVETMGTGSDMTLVGIRGSVIGGARNEYESSLNIAQTNIVPDVYSCSILVMRDNMLAGYRATTLPGAFYTKNPESPRGAARLLPGRWLFSKGLHKGMPALRQVAPMLVLGDIDEDYQMDYDSDKPDAGMFGIDMHAGGGMVIGKWSAGCQVIMGDISAGVSRSWTSDPWTSFYEMISQSGNSNFQYILVPATWLSATWTGLLLPGSIGPAVHESQEKLGVDVDGVYGISTALAVMKYQASQNIQPNGMIGPDTANALLGHVIE